MARHVTKAREQGWKAGFNTLVEYLGGPLGSTNPHMDEVREAIDGLNTEAQRRKWYCETYGVPAEPKVTVGKTRRSRSRLAGDTPKPERKVRSARKPVSGIITNDEAWVAAGSNPTFKPKPERANEPPSGGLLYRLNLEGKLAIIS